MCPHCGVLHSSEKAQTALAHGLEESHRHAEQREPDTEEHHVDQVQNQIELHVRLEVRIAVSLVGRFRQRVSGCWLHSGGG